MGAYFLNFTLESPMSYTNKFSLDIIYPIMNIRKNFPWFNIAKHNSNLKLNFLVEFSVALQFANHPPGQLLNHGESREKHNLGVGLSIDLLI